MSNNNISKKYIVQQFIKNMAEITEAERIIDLDEIEDELEFSFHETESINVSNGKKLSLPNNETVISRQDDCITPKSLFMDDEWYFRYNKNTVAIKLGKDHKICQDNEILNLCLTDRLAAPLVRFQKILVYFCTPQTNPYSATRSPNTTLKEHGEITHLLTYFYQNGFLLGDNKGYKSLQSLDVATLQAEVKKRIASNNYPLRLARAISKWAFISRVASLPVEFSATFTENEFWGNGLSKKLAAYEAKNCNRWEAIDFEDLVSMTKTSISYVMDRSEDLIFLEKMFRKAYSRRKFAGHEPRPEIRVGGARAVKKNITADLAKKVLDYKFSLVCKENNEPWMSIKLSDGKKRGKLINKKPIIKEWEILIGSCIFILLLWTGARKDELRMLLISALTIDGIPVDPKKNIINQVRGGKRFNLKRTETKITGGAKIDLPIPESGAMAFAVLVELFRGVRKLRGSNFLLPAGGLKLKINKGRTKHQLITDPVNSGYIPWRLYALCSAAGVDRQHPHKCRKTLATVLINHDPNSLELIKRILGHKDVSMTYEYLMSLPGVTEVVMKKITEDYEHNIADFLADAIEGKVAGPAGNRALDVIRKNPEYFLGETRMARIKGLIRSLTAPGSNFTLVRTGAATCFRFPSPIPFLAPCIPPANQRQTGIIYVPNISLCDPVQCKNSAHTSDDVLKAKRNQQYAKKKQSESKTSAAKAHYQTHVKYWTDVVEQLQFGRADIVELHLIDKIFGGLK